MTLQRMLMISLAVGLAGGLFAYFLAWGFFTTHPELGMDSGRGVVIALWVAPLVFVGSLIYLSVKKRGR